MKDINILHKNGLLYVYIFQEFTSLRLNISVQGRSLQGLKVDFLELNCYSEVL